MWALDQLDALLPKHLSWKESGKDFDGVLAHEVQAVVPDAVKELSTRLQALEGAA